MKRTWIALAAIAATAGAGAVWWGFQRREADDQVLRPLGPTRIDFPPVLRGEPVELVQVHDFRFRNDLDHPVRVASATASCTCTTATAEPETVPPGGELVVKTITTLDQAGSRHATVWVRFDEGTGVEMRLSAALLRPVILSTSPANPRPAEGASELQFTLIWTSRDGTEAPGTPEFVADRGEVVAEIGPWAPRPVDPGVFGPDGPPAAARAFAGSVRVTTSSGRWPVILTVKASNADPLPLQLRDLLPGE